MDQQEYFTVQHSLAVNVEPLEATYPLPDEETFVDEIPKPFLIASQFSGFDLLTDRAVNELRASDLSNVVQLIEAQNSKLNLLLTFMLSQQNNPAHEQQTITFGASKFTYQTATAPDMDQVVRVKLFTEHPASAVYCYGRVSDIEPSETSATVTITFEVMREEDQDILIKAALFQQQKLLRQRSLARNEKQ